MHPCVAEIFADSSDALADTMRKRIALVASAQVLLDALNEHTVDAGAGVDAVASFDNVNVMAPRGRFEVEMYLSFLKLIGQVRHGPARASQALPSPGLPVAKKRHELPAEGACAACSATTSSRSAARRAPCLEAPRACW